MTGRMTDISSPPRLLRFAVLGLCFASGAAALVYQVVWVRQLGLVFGVSTYAVATVLAAFMGGLALGGVIFGRRALTVERPLVLFAFLELGIAASALLLPLGFQAVAAGYAGIHRLLGDAPAIFGLARFFLVALLLVVPTSLMGGTVAVLARVQSRREETLGGDVGALYGWNTLGAVVGAFAAGFVMIATLGLTTTTWIAVGVNVAIGLNALVLARLAGTAREVGGTSREVGGTSREVGGTSREAGDTSRGVGGTSREVGDTSFGTRLAWMVFAVSGFCALGYEVLWARTLVFYLHNSTYAFTAMLSFFLAGIGLGSLLPARWLGRSERPAAWLGASQLLIGGWTILALFGFASLPKVLELVTRWTTIDAWWKALAVQGIQAGLVLLPAAFGMGLSFPAAVRLAARLETVSRDVGRLYALNTAGAIVGSLGVGFLLLPNLGIVGSFRLLIALNLAAGGVALAAEFAPDDARKRRRRIVTAALVALLVAALGVLIVPGDVFRRAFAGEAEILFYRDGATDTVMVKARDLDAPERALYFTDARGTAGTMTNPENRVYGHLPLLLHGDAERVLTIGFGVGNTLAAMVRHPEVESVDLVELSPNVFAAAPYFPTNDRAWEDPRVAIHLGDGRNHLLASRETWDVVQLEPPEIHTEGVVYLYTEELYGLVREHLAPGGILCQWLNVRMMPLREQKMLVRTFLEVFPEGTVWLPRLMTGYILLIAGEEELVIDYGRFRRGFEVAPVRRDLAENAGIRTPEGLLAGFKLSAESARRWSAGVPVVTDDHTRVDFTTPRSVDANYGLSNAFSGLTVPAFLPGGWEPTRDYQIEKLREIASTTESVVPHLEGFASTEERARVTARLEAIAERFQKLTAARLEALERMEDPLVNM